MSLSSQSQKILHEYFNLPFKGLVGVLCPYFNNARAKQRAQLRVLIGKGLPQDIVEEAQIISMQYHAGLFDKDGRCCLYGSHVGRHASGAEIRKFLIDHNLGVECSGFVTQILRAHFKEIKNIDIAKRFFVVSSKHFLRWIIAKFRPIENISVRVWANDLNTRKLDDWKTCDTGDVIVMLETGPNRKRNHIILILENDGRIIRYAHARAWMGEGKYGHGVAEGAIKIISPGKNILEQEWEELGAKGEENETYLEAKNAKLLEVRRIRN